jgi:formyl-CoA transferase
VIVAGNDVQFRRLCEVLGLEALADDDRYKTNSMRVVNRQTLQAAIEERLQSNTKAFWLKQLEEANLVAGPINSLEEALNDPQALARNVVRHIAHPSGGTVPIVASPMRLSRTPLDQYSAPPTCGQHTDEVIAELLAE